MDELTKILYDRIIAVEEKLEHRLNRIEAKMDKRHERYNKDMFGLKVKVAGFGGFFGIIAAYLQAKFFGK